ncbi:hypothetical protein [Marimonas arenosa]|uniref:Uncharacterized protein n=1 Tax=Marimonas arenosa TaxID=1795305 RepID=A0AAE3WIM9_9RHOB|nr:hypothetical protein [Marimonas arenosa]MDQ2092350.1 hypothetical protein [Marimonas arenosa]
MSRLSQGLVLLAFSFALWAFCGSLIAAGQLIMSMDATLVLHATGAPIGAVVAAWTYFRFFGSFTPLAVALAFLVTAVLLDVFVVAMLIERSFAMFASPLGTWIPLTLIFLAALVTGLAMRQ